MKNVCYCGREWRKTLKSCLCFKEIERRRHHLTSNGWSCYWHGQGWGRCGGCGGMSVPVARVRANFLQPEWGGKDRWGTKFSWSVVMQQTPHLSSSSIHWAASCWCWFSPSQVLWILFGAGCMWHGQDLDFQDIAAYSHWQTDWVPKAPSSVVHCCKQVKQDGGHGHLWGAPSGKSKWEDTGLYMLPFCQHQRSFKFNCCLYRSEQHWLEQLVLLVCFRRINIYNCFLPHHSRHHSHCIKNGSLFSCITQREDV